MTWHGAAKPTGFFDSLPGLIGLDCEVPDFSTLRRRRKALAVNISYRRSPGPLHLLIDIEPASATGSSEPARGIEGEGEWNARRHDGTKRRLWRKIHLGINEKTSEVRAIEVTSGDTDDAPCCPNCWPRSLPIIT